MPSPEPVRVLFLAGKEAHPVEPLRGYLNAVHHLQVEFRPTSRLPSNLGDSRVIVLVNPPSLSPADQERLRTFVGEGGGCLGLAGPPMESLPALFGARVGHPGPSMELRLNFPDPEHPIAQRLPPELYLRDRFQPLEASDEKSHPALVTMWHYQRVAVALLREEGKGKAGCTTLQAYKDPLFQQIVYRLIRHLAGVRELPPLRVAILGYGPHGAMGCLHGRAAQEVPGLKLRAFCDLSPERLSQCREDFPGCKTYRTASELAHDSEVDVVIIATPPNTHAALALELLRAGKHVVCEKPMCLTTEEAEAMIQAAEENGRLLSCYQNRRWDADYLAIRQALEEGLVGEPFYLETFVGDFNHPCHYWHSHRPISGDAVYDWGAHYVDWMLNLFPGSIASVIGTLHKRVWRDVTNADQVRVQIRFADGREAEFLHSNVAALRKPKWYLLGTEGAIVSQWNELPVHQLDPITYFREEKIPVTETPPLLTLRRRDPRGSMVVQQLPLVKPRRFPYHLNLADHLLTGEPLAVSAHSAARVVAVLEAATRSAEKGGNPESLHV